MPTLQHRRNIVQAYKLKGKIDAAGNLMIAEPIKLPPGDVEVIVLPASETVTSPTATATEPQPEKSKRKTKIKAFQSWFEETQPASPDFDTEQARWEALKEKYNL
jgi:hypothetical protein